MRKICHPAHLRATAHFGAQALEIVENAGLPTESANSRVVGSPSDFDDYVSSFDTETSSVHVLK